MGQTSRKREPITAEQFCQLQELAGNIRFGSINLIFQDGQLIQIDKNEKFRTQKKSNQSTG